MQDSQKAKEAKTATSERTLAAIMFTDMVGYSALTQTNEALALELLESHHKLLRPIFSQYGGREIKTIGDALLVEFNSALEAGRCAIEVQRTLATHNATATPKKRIQIRIGIHVGDVVHQGGDVFGDAVNIASRIEPLARPGGVCISEDVTRQIQNKIEEPLRKIGKNALKNIQIPVEVYEIALPWMEEEKAISAKTLLPHVPQQKGRERLAWTLTATAIIVAGTAFTMLFKMRPATVSDSQRYTALAAATQITSYGDTETFGALAPDGKSFAFVSKHGGTPDIWARQVSGGEPVRLTNDPPEERDLVYAPDGETIYFTRTDESGPAVWRIGALGGQARIVVRNALMPAPAPDGRRLVYLTLGNPASLVVIDLDGQGARTLVKGINPGAGNQRPSPAWSPDGRRIAYNQWGLFTPHNMFVVDTRTGQTRQVTHFTASSEGISWHAWLPDNRHLAVSYVPFSRQLESEDLGILDVEDGSVTRLTLGIGQTFERLTVSADGSRLLATVSEGAAEVWKVPLGADPDANGRAAVRLLDDTYYPYWIFVSRDGHTLLFSGLFTGSRNLWTMQLDRSAPPQQITQVEGSAVMHSSLSPDGSHVAFASSRTGNSDIWVQNVDGSDLRQLTNDDATDYWPVWSPDGRWIVFGKEGNVPETWSVPAVGGPAQKVTDGFFRGDWIEKPDGNGTWLVTSDRTPGLRLLDFEQRKVLWERRVSGNAMPVFSPDGKLISHPVREGSGRESIWIFDTTTGQGRVAVRFPEPFSLSFRAGWTDGGKALIVNRQRRMSHIILLDRFWVREGARDGK